MPPRRKFKTYCESCGNELRMNKSGCYPRRFCSIRCFYDFNKGENNYRYKGRLENKGHEYIRLRIDKKIVLEHRYLVEKLLGRELNKNEYVHHIDGNKKNNKISNLAVMKDREHTIFHLKGKPNLGSRKHSVVLSLPNATKVGETFSVLPQYRVFRTIKCDFCEKLYWKRMDHKTRVCGTSCAFAIKRRENGIPKNKYYHYRHDM